MPLLSSAQTIPLEVPFAETDGVGDGHEKAGVFEMGPVSSGLPLGLKAHAFIVSGYPGLALPKYT